VKRGKGAEGQRHKEKLTTDFMIRVSYKVA